jgi:hypothetical protein
MSSPNWRAEVTTWMINAYTPSSAEATGGRVISGALAVLVDPPSDLQKNLDHCDYPVLR